MKRITDSTRIIESRELGGATYEVCATVNATFDEIESLLTVILNSFVRNVNPHGPDAICHPQWLPRVDIIHEHMSAAEAGDEAREALNRWTTKVKARIPDTQTFLASMAAEHGAGCRVETRR